MGINLRNGKATFSFRNIETATAGIIIEKIVDMLKFEAIKNGFSGSVCEYVSHFSEDYLFVLDFKGEFFETEDLKEIFEIKYQGIEELHNKALEVSVFADADIENKLELREKVHFFLRFDKNSYTSTLLSMGEKLPYNIVSFKKIGYNYYNLKTDEVEDISNYELSVNFTRQLEGAETKFRNEAEWIITGNILSVLVKNGVKRNTENANKVLAIVRYVEKNLEWDNLGEFEECISAGLSGNTIEIIKDCKIVLKEEFEQEI
jgi:hypothetical protein